MGSVFDVSRACVDDGPGLRTVVFLKGCHLGCPWCHNFEGQSTDVVIGLDPSRCIGCGACAEACPRYWSIDEPDAWRRGCLGCGACVAACPSGARRRSGRDVSAAQLVAELLVDRDFFEGTAGGVTFSGGEPLVQAELLFDCAARLRAEGVHVAVETAGFWPQRLAARLAASVDLVLFDLKHADPAALARVTGRDGRVILTNLQALLASGVTVELRVTLVPGFNDGVADLSRLAALVGELGARLGPVRLLPFARLAAGKQVIYGVPYPYRHVLPPTDAALDAAVALLGQLGVRAARG